MIYVILSRLFVVVFGSLVLFYGENKFNRDCMQHSDGIMVLDGSPLDGPILEFVRIEK